MRLSVVSSIILIALIFPLFAAEPVDIGAMALHIYWLTWALVEAVLTIDSLLLRLIDEDNISPTTLMEIQSARQRLYGIILVLKNN